MHLFLFSYDMRGLFNTLAKHWNKGNDKVYFNTLRDPAALSIDVVSEEDDADYRCRIDFTRSPTRNHRVKLIVVGKSLLILRSVMHGA